MARLLIELCSPVDEVVDLLRGLADDQLDDFRVAQSGAGRHRVADMIFEPVFGRENARDAALGVAAVTLLDSVLRHYENINIPRHGETGPHSGDATADHEDIREEVRGTPAIKSD